LIRGIGDGMSDFISEPIKGLKKSVEELNPTLFVDGVARGTGSLARHTVVGFADSASLLTDTLSKNMAVLTLDRSYAQRRDRVVAGRDSDSTTMTRSIGIGSQKLFQGVIDGLTGVVKAPIRGAEKHGIEGFAKGVGKGLLGLVVKPVIGISDAATDVMIGVKSSVEVGNGGLRKNQMRPRRTLYGHERAVRAYTLGDATASSLMMRSRLAGDLYMSHCDIGNKVALLSSKRLLLLGEDGHELMMLKFKLINHTEVTQVPKPSGGNEWGVLLFISNPKRKSAVDIISCGRESIAIELCSQIKRCINLSASEV